MSRTAAYTLDAFVLGMGERCELVYRLAGRGLCARRRGYRAFSSQTNELTA